MGYRAASSECKVLTHLSFILRGYSAVFIKCTCYYVLRARGLIYHASEYDSWLTRDTRTFTAFVPNMRHIACVLRKNPDGVDKGRNNLRRVTPRCTWSGDI